MTSLKAGIIGLGVGEQHIAGYQHHPQVEVTHICDIDPAKLAEVSARHPDLQATPDPAVLLQHPDLDVLSIASYDDAHYPQIVEAIVHNKHLFVEKPLCLFPEQARHIRQLLSTRPWLKLSSNLILRRCPRFLDLRERIQRGELGELYYLEGDYNYGRLQKIISGWRGQQPFYSVVYGGGVHLVDLMIWLTGQRVIEVSAMGSAKASSGTGFRFNDLVISLLRFENGLLAKMAVNFACVHPHFHPLNVYGTQATFINGLHQAELFTERDPEQAPKTLNTTYPGVQKGALIASFIEEILSGQPGWVSHEDVFETLSVCFAIEQAVQQRCTVGVDYI